MNFSELGLSAPLLRAVEEQNYTEATPIQASVIPAILKDRDVMAMAQTGTGKTAAFILPILEKLQHLPKVSANRCRALVLVPTRELAMQVADNARDYAIHTPYKAAVVYGGVKINPQMMRLRGGADILVATPGRLLDLYENKAIRFDELAMLVLDEADRMLDMGFIHDIQKILALLPKKRQTLLFSATFSPEIRALSKNVVHNPYEASIAPQNVAQALVEQWVYPIDKNRKNALLLHLIQSEQWHQAIVFCRTKYGADKLAKYLSKEGVKAAAVHGDKSQAQRIAAVNDFKSGKVHILVATDIAARGLHIQDLPQVVNIDLPHVSEDYVHRIGRTGRAGSNGCAVSLVCAEEFKQLQDIERLLKKPIERKVIKGFEPIEKLPASKPADGLQRVKKPKKPKNTNNVPSNPVSPTATSATKKRFSAKPKYANGRSFHDKKES